jgi:hypothetical protein
MLAFGEGFSKRAAGGFPFVLSGSKVSQGVAMARGWGRSEEDLPGDREQARPEGEPGSPDLSPRGLELLRRRRPIELSLARVRAELSKINNPGRRLALQTAERELLEQLRELEAQLPQAGR